jgi:hypothetical protein
LNLSAKATRFVIEALEHYQKYQDEQLQQPGLSEEEAADLVNDRQYLEDIKKEFEKHHDDLLAQRPGRAG